ncbi:MAG TPA: transposase [Thermodesulfobacteriota bacterium]|nr:transposase [Deltaproteobacteria bacterium]HNR13674.1 transposase [Thermodesulfobacteriota bacterium]
MPRQARLDAPGTLHHIMIRGIERRSIVTDDADRQLFVDRMGSVALDTRTHIYAWSLMTNHAHVLLRSGIEGIANFMRRFLTGYAVSYNRRHHRYGHLFQNRYKSIVCEEEGYFRELVRYIHLNPLRAGLVKDMHELDRYSWSGHRVIMGVTTVEWQNRDYVLGWFGKRRNEAKGKYREFVMEGVKQGRRPELVGGGLVRTLGGWSEVKSIRRRTGEKIAADERVLGSGEFVEQLWREADERLKRASACRRSAAEVRARIELLCREGGVSKQELEGRSRRREVSQLRGKLAQELVVQYGMQLAEAARQLGVSTAAIANILNRTHVS